MLTSRVFGFPLTKVMSLIWRLPVGGESKLLAIPTASFWKATAFAAAVAFVDR